jgi:hypothetical protein
VVIERPQPNPAALNQATEKNDQDIFLFPGYLGVSVGVHLRLHQKVVTISKKFDNMFAPYGSTKWHPS